MFQIWDIKTGRCKRSINEHKGTVKVSKINIFIKNIFVFKIERIFKNK